MSGGDTPAGDLDEAERAIPLRPIEADVCDLCVTGAGGECHVPGCAFWIHDAPTGDAIRVLARLVQLTEWKARVMAGEEGNPDDH